MSRGFRWATRGAKLSEASPPSATCLPETPTTQLAPLILRRSVAGRCFAFIGCERDRLTSKLQWCPMKILALVGEEQWHALRSIIPRDCKLAGRVTGAPGAQRLDVSFADLVIVDPGQYREDAFLNLFDQVSRAGVPLVLWADLTSTSARRAVLVAREIPVDLLLRPYDSELVKLRKLLAGHAHASPWATVFHRIAERLSSLPAPILQSAALLFGGARGPSSVADFVVQTRFHRRSVERALNRAGIVSAARLLNVARLCHMWSYLHQPSYSLSEIAIRSGFLSPRALNAQCNHLLGVPPRRVLHAMTLAEFGDRLRDSLLVGSG
jgi:AraC-like DNA-binding protein